MIPLVDLTAQYHSIKEEIDAAVNTKNRSHTITAEVVIPDGGAEGVLVASGGRFGGYSLYVKDGLLHYAYNLLGTRVDQLSSADRIPSGPCTLGFSFEKTGQAMFGAGGVARLYINGRPAGEGELKRTIPFFAGLSERLHCGRQDGSATCDEYGPPFEFTGTLKRVIIDVTGHEPPRDITQEAEIGLARQ